MIDMINGIATKYAKTGNKKRISIRIGVKKKKDLKLIKPGQESKTTMVDGILAATADFGDIKRFEGTKKTLIIFC